MSLIPCSACQERKPNGEKLSQVTWAWYLANQSRTAYRQRLCVQCFCQNVLGLDKPWTPGEPLTCPSCGIDVSDDMDPVYATCFIPSSGKLALELALCSSCAVEVRTRAQAGAQHLENRDPGVEGRALDTPPPDAVWAALGIVPR